VFVGYKLIIISDYTFSEPAGLFDVLASELNTHFYKFQTSVLFYVFANHSQDKWLGIYPTRSFGCQLDASQLDAIYLFWHNLYSMCNLFEYY